MNVAGSRNSQSRGDVINWYRILPVLAFPTGKRGGNLSVCAGKVFNNLSNNGKCRPPADPG